MINGVTIVLTKMTLQGYILKMVSQYHAKKRDTQTWTFLKLYFL
jgi:O-antigen/teichoic acid export membrane protein